MSDAAELVWVSLDVLRGNQTSGYRGRMALADYEALVSGNFGLPFVLLEDVHWVEVAWNQQTGQREVTVHAFGRTREWEWYAGSIYLRPESIATLAPLKEEYPEFLQRSTGG